MSELILDRRKRKDPLKHMIQRLHAGEAPDAVRPQLVRLLGQVPRDEVVEVEQELISEGLPQQEVLALEWKSAALQKLYDKSAAASDGDETARLLNDLRGHFNALMDVEKHYQREENLLWHWPFPYTPHQ